MVRLFSSLLTIAFLSISTTAQAIPVSFTQTVETNVGLTGFFSSGDTVSITVTMDNGGTSTASQTWTTAQILGAVLTVGSYSASYGDTFCGDFTSTATGSLSTAFCGTLASTGVDNSGVGARLYNGTIRISDGTLVGLSNNLAHLAAWSGGSIAGPPLPPVPLPAGLPLLLGAIGLFGLAKRRRNAA